MDKFNLTEDMFEYISLQRTGIKNGFEKKYYDNIKFNWDDMKDYVGEPNKVLDIGCGIGGIDYFIAKQFQNCHLYLLDENKLDETIMYGYNNKSSYYNSLELSEKFLRLNNISNEITLLTPDNDLSILKEIDLVISLISWGFHYPIETYLDLVSNCTSENAKVIIDIRHTILVSSISLFESRGFKYNTISKHQKCDRILFYK